MDTKPFNPWPIGLVITFLIFFGLQAWFVTICETHFEPPEDAHYYRDGLHYGRVMEQERLQRRLGWTVQPKLPNPILSGKVFPVEVDVRDKRHKPVSGARVMVEFGHPATMRGDRVLHLVERGPGRYVNRLSLPSGVWKVWVTVKVGSDVFRETVLRMAVGPA